MTTRETLELEDIQGGVLHPLPIPFVGTYALLRIDRAAVGRELLARIVPTIRSAADPTNAAADAWVSVALTWQGLKALGVPSESLATFPREFQQGMAARAPVMRDVGESAPENWEHPFGSAEVHMAISAMAPDQDRFNAVFERARDAYTKMDGVTALYRQECHQGSSGREAFGYKDNISQPAVEGSGIPGSNPAERPLKPGEFVLGYADETGAVAPMPVPEVLARNGSYFVVRKLHQRVAALRQYLCAQSADPSEEELLAAKIMGRWRSGAPLALAPERDEPGLGSDSHRNNDFLFAGDRQGFGCPVGSHVRRMNPRDGLEFGDVRIRRLIRREASYGPSLPDGVLEDDGIDRGMMFACVGANLRRQFEFVQGEWLNSGIFVGQSDEVDPLCGANDGSGAFTIPERPIRRRLQGLPAFVVTRGGEYFFMPGLRALRWLAALQT